VKPTPGYRSGAPAITIMAAADRASRYREAAQAESLVIRTFGAITIIAKMTAGGIQRIGHHHHSR